MRKESFGKESFGNESWGKESFGKESFGKESLTTASASGRRGSVVRLGRTPGRVPGGARSFADNGCLSVKRRFAALRGSQSRGVRTRYDAAPQPRGRGRVGL
jgi:hypothetical protein